MADPDLRQDPALLAALAEALRPLEPAPERAGPLRRRVQAALDAEPALPEAFSAGLAAGLGAEEPPAEVRERIRARVQAGIEAEQAQARSATLTVHSGEGQWFDVAPGVSIKPLFADPRAGARSFLMRLAPGASYPAHEHSYHEECMVLEGDVRIGETRVGPGDYHLAPSGSRHETLSSVHGALLFLRAGHEDTELDAAGKLSTVARTLWNRLRGR